MRPFPLSSHHVWCLPSGQEWSAQVALLPSSYHVLNKHVGPFSSFCHFCKCKQYTKTSISCSLSFRQCSLRKLVTNAHNTTWGPPGSPTPPTPPVSQPLPAVPYTLHRQSSKPETWTCCPVLCLWVDYKCWKTNKWHLRYLDYINIIYYRAGKDAKMTFF